MLARAPIPTHLAIVVGGLTDWSSEGQAGFALSLVCLEDPDFAEKGDKESEGDPSPLLAPSRFYLPTADRVSSSHHLTA
jgi:hypothetical protein